MATIGPLTGTVGGALITMMSARNVENRRAQRESRERFEALRREAIGLALEWIEPMRTAQNRASSLVMAGIRGDIAEEEVLRGFPYLIDQLRQRDLSGAQRAVLPAGTYERGHKIVFGLEEVRTKGIQYSQEARVMGKHLAGFGHLSARFDALGGADRLVGE